MRKLIAPLLAVVAVMLMFSLAIAAPPGPQANGMDHEGAIVQVAPATVVLSGRHETFTGFLAVAAISKFYTEAYPVVASPQTLGGGGTNNSQTITDKTVALEHQGMPFAIARSITKDNSKCASQAANEVSPGVKQDPGVAEVAPLKILAGCSRANLSVEPLSMLSPANMPNEVALRRIWPQSVSGDIVLADGMHRTSAECYAAIINT